MPTTSVFMQIKSIMSGCSIGDAKEDIELDQVLDIINN